MLAVFTNTNFSNNTNEPDGLYSWSFLLEFYPHSIRTIRVRLKTRNAGDFTNTNFSNKANEPDGL